MRWDPITPENAVARLQAASEHALSDFKVRYDTTDPTKSFEIAKDVCAFANHLGGTITVGAQEDTGTRRGRISALLPLTNPSPGELIKEIDRTIRLNCLPVPIVNAIEIPLNADQVEAIQGRPGAAISIVAINVQPAVKGPVGCLSCSDECKTCKTTAQTCSCKGKAIPDAYRFPIRVIEGVRFLRPDELARVMNVAERRALLDLQALVDEPNVTVWFNPQDGTRGVSRPCKVTKLDAENMICTLRVAYAPDPEDEETADIPLTFFRAAWRTALGWSVAFDGIAFELDGRKRHGYFPPGGFRA